MIFYKFLRIPILTLLAASANAYFFAEGAMAEDTKVQGIPFVILSDVYKYNSGGVPLLGYIVQRVENKDDVKFLICSSGNTISVSFKSLEQVKTKCPNSQAGGGLWSAWVFSSGRLLASANADTPQNPNVLKWKDAFKAIDVSELPASYRAALYAVQPGHVAAYSFPTEDGAMALGIVQY